MFWQHSEKKLLKKPKIYSEFKYLIDEMNSSFFYVRLFTVSIPFPSDAVSTQASMSNSASS